MREALTRLQADGLIESRRGAGSFVRQRPAEREVLHLRSAQVRARLNAFEVRIAAEPVAAHRAAEPGGDHDLRFHRAVAAAAHNPMFLLTLDTLEAEVEGMIVPSLALIARERHERANLVELEHVAVVKAIERGDAECAEAAMRLHLAQARRRVMDMRW